MYKYITHTCAQTFTLIHTITLFFFFLKLHKRKLANAYFNLFPGELLKCGVIRVNFQHSAHEWRESFSIIAFPVPTMPGSQTDFQDF